jgi:phosphoglucosamine mutase
VIAAEKKRRGANCEGVVGTLMSNLGMEIALRELGVPFARAKVGDRYVLEMMERNGWRLGGESSGHIICGDVTTTGDGIVSALQVLAAMRSSNRTLKELCSAMSKYPQTMINVTYQRTVDLDADTQVQAAMRDAKAKLGDRGRVLLRASGTEPLIRVMVEGEDAALVEQQARSIAAAVRTATA